jgi:S-adenosylmethionine decarboxylase
MQGLHLTADLSECAGTAAMTDVQALRRLCLDAVLAAGLTPVGELFHRFPAPGGVTGVVLLAESHLAVHTWPERAAVTLDAYVCNVSGDNTAAARQLVEQLIAAFAPQGQHRQQLQRGRALRPSAG